jgi:hypothetical protein
MRNKVVDMQDARIDMKSIRGYGLHGALGLLMGIGAGNITSFFLSIIISITGFTSEFFYRPVLLIGELSVIFVIYGVYTGYIFGGEKRSSEQSKSGAIIGVVCGFAATSLFAVNFTLQRSALDPLFFTLFIAGFIYGLPKLKNMVLLAVSGVIGGVAGYEICISGENLTYYLNDIWSPGGLFTTLIPILFNSLAIGLAGASIAIGIYFSEGISYTAREIPGFLKKTRSAGIVLTFIALFVSSLMFVSIAKYASTEVTIQISSNNGTLYVPVLLDENGNVLEMYRKPVITGSAVSAIIDTEHGKALKITGTGEIGINMKQTDGKMAGQPDANEKFVNGWTLSTSNATRYGELQEAEAWVYSEGGGRFNFFIKRDNGWGREISIQTSQKLTDGWQVVSLSVRNIMYD